MSSPPASPPCKDWGRVFKDKYIVGAILGEGSYSVVRTVYNRYNGKKRAVKILFKEEMDDDDIE